MSNLTNKEVNLRFLAVTIVVILMATYIAKREQKLVIQVSEADQRILDCLPDDQGVQSVLTLEDTSDGLTLHCEKHAAGGFGQTKPKAVSYLVPIIKD